MWTRDYWARAEAPDPGPGPGPQIQGPGLGPGRARDPDPCIPERFYRRSGIHNPCIPYPIGLNGPYLHTSLPQDNQHFVYMHLMALGHGETMTAQSGPGPWPTTPRKNKCVSSPSLQILNSRISAIEVRLFN